LAFSFPGNSEKLNFREEKKMNNWYSIEVEIQRRQNEVVAWAEKYALEHPFLRRDGIAVKRYQRWLVRLGAQLVVWGCRLQARYDTLVTTTVTTAVTTGNGYTSLLQQEKFAVEVKTKPCSG
jgi:hypothetical protein